MSSKRPNIIARGPETIPRPGTWQYEAHKGGRRFFEPVLPGQYFPEGANQKRLDELAHQRRDELGREAAMPAVSSVAAMELPEPEPEAEMPAVPKAAAA